MTEHLRVFRAPHKWECLTGNVGWTCRAAAQRSQTRRCLSLGPHHAQLASSHGRMFRLWRSILSLVSRTLRLPSSVACISFSIRTRHASGWIALGPPRILARQPLHPASPPERKSASACTPSLAPLASESQPPDRPLASPNLTSCFRLSHRPGLADRHSRDHSQVLNRPCCLCRLPSDCPRPHHTLRCAVDTLSPESVL